MPELKTIPLADIREPQTAVRVAMDDEAFESLKTSMNDVGLIQPIVLIPNGDIYEVEAGHRRFLAARALHWKEIPAVVYQPDEIQHEAAKLHENLFREDVTAAEEALFFMELVEKHGYDEDRLCTVTRRTPDYIAGRLNLLRGDQDIFKALMDRLISFSAARELNRLKDANVRRMYLDQAIRSGAPARIVKGWVDTAEHLKVEVGDAGQAQPDPAPIQTEDGHSMECWLCGGYKDTYNLQMVWIHTYCMGQLNKSLQQLQQEKEG